MQMKGKFSNKGYRMDSLFGKLPARRMRPSKCANTGVFASRKNGRGSETESLLEEDFLTLLEFDHRVERFDVQPTTLRWSIGAEQFIYTPDVLVKYTASALRVNSSLKPTIYEVKPYEVLKRDWSKFEHKFRYAISWARENGMRFKIITDKRIRTPYLDNARFLLGFQSSTFHYSSLADEVRDERYVLSTLAHLGAVTPKQLLPHLSEFKSRQAELIPWIWRLILEDKIQADLDKPLTMISPISLKAEYPGEMS
jgi:hypothetical protein